jgi:uncharacterized protein YndB with AHSA1/START domain
MTTQSAGRIDITTGTATLSFTRRFDASIEDVWDALANPSRRGRWLGETVLEPREGGSIEVLIIGPPVPDDVRRVTGRVLAWDPPHRLEHEWNQAIIGRTVVRYELEADGDGTLLRLTHRGLRPDDASGFASGTHAFLDRLEALLSDEDLPSWPQRFAEVEHLYLNGHNSTANGAHKEQAGRGNDAFGVVPARGAIRFERMLPGPIDRVWNYLVDSELRGRWLATGDMPRTPDEGFNLRFIHADLSPIPEEIPEKYSDFANGCDLPCRLTAIEPPHMLRFLWTEGTEVTFRLKEVGDRVRLVLIHEQIDDTDMIDVAAGWHTHLGILIDYLEGRTPKPFWREHTRFEEEYEHRLNASGGY